MPGVTITLERLGDGSYEGTAGSARARVTVDDAGAVVVILEPADEDLAEKVRLIVRTAYRHAKADERPMPHRIQRWRE